MIMVGFNELEFPRIFLHFFDIHFMKQKGFSEPHNAIFHECRLATRLGIAVADSVIVPAASFVESTICRSIILEHSDLLALGVIEVAGNANHLAHFRDRKLSEYPKGSFQHDAYSNLNPEALAPPFRIRVSSATSDLVTYWTELLHKVDFVSDLRKRVSEIPEDFEDTWARVPERLQDLAFVVSHVQRHLGPVSTHPEIENFLHKVINQGYFESYTREFQAGIVTDMVYMDAGYRIESWGRDLPYRSLVRALQNRALLSAVDTCPPTELLTLSNNPSFVSALLESLGSSSDVPLNASDERRFVAIGGIEEMEKLQVFIVHGHDRALLLELKDYLQNTLKFPEPIVLVQQPNAGRTIIEKFEDLVEPADVAVVLLTPDDVAIDGQNEVHNRARQNVVFELGFFVGKFGRKSGRVILLHKGNIGSIEIPSDLNGVTYIEVGAGITAAGEEIRLELQRLTKLNASRL